MPRSERATTHHAAAPVSRALSVTELERMWQSDRDSPAEPWSSPTRIIVRRSSPDDLRNDRLRVLIDGCPLARLGYGETSGRIVTPGFHAVRVANPFFSRTCVVEVRPGRQVCLQCGTGRLRAAWLTRALSRLGRWYPWLAPEPDR
jgi:hypothetical protein